MSLLDDVSIVVTPNGYKAGELYAVIPVPTEGAEEIVNGDFATDTDWTKGTGWSISGGTANCNNTSGSTQDLKTENRILNLGGKRVQISFTVSNYSGSASMTVTLQGTGGNDFSGINANGTYTTLSLISPTDNSIDLLFKASNGWVGSIDNVSVKEYTSADMDVTRETDATRVDENGLVEKLGANVPRIDYTGGGCPHILAEPQRTNIAEYSEQLDVAPNVIDNANYTSNFYVSPNGLTTAPKFEETTANDRHGFYQYQTVTSNSYSVSIYAKEIDRRFICLQSNLTSINQFTFFDLQLGTVVSEGTGWTATINAVGSSGWYKLTATCTAVAGSRYVIFGGSVDGLSNTYVGDGSLFTFWGLQLEEGSYATSYIPTIGSTVTRNQDIFTRDGIGSLINSEEGVLFVEMAALSDDGTNRYLSISDGSINNYIYFRFMSTSNRVLMRTVVAGVTINTLQITITDTTDFNKYALKWKSGDYAFWINGVESVVDASATIFSADVLNQLEFSFPTSGGGGFPSKVKQLQVYDTALTDDQIRQITQ